MYLIHFGTFGPKRMDEEMYLFPGQDHPGLNNVLNTFSVVVRPPPLRWGDVAKIVKVARRA